MAIDTDSIGAVPYGPSRDALLEAVALGTNTLGYQGAYLLDALDLTSPTWDAGRPPWHLELIEQCYCVRPEPTVGDDLRYRLARARVCARHAAGRLDEIIAVFSALIGSAGVDPARMRIITQPMLVTVIFAAEAAPPAAVYDRVVDIAKTAVQDVAGFGLIKAADGVTLEGLFTLDIGPGFDVGKLAGPLGP